MGAHDTITARSVLTWIVAKPLANGLAALVWPAGALGAWSAQLGRFGEASIDIGG